MIDANRYIKTMQDISKFGALDGGGITRLAFSKEEKQAREYILSIAKKLGLIYKIDAFGNIFLTLKGKDSSKLPVTTGSHVDSVPNGGCFDGTLGVMSSLEAITSIKEHCDKTSTKTLRDITIIIFSAEESSRFKMATMGSKLMAGKLDEQRLKELKDEDGISAYDAAKNFGCDVGKLNEIKLKKDSFYSYIELHIEQGPVLENLKIPVGIVTGIAAPIRFELTIFGRADHSGATPMNMRKDALVMASKLIIECQKIAKLGKHTVGTVGYAKATPGVLNVISGSVTLGVDIRDIDVNDLNLANDRFREAVDKLCKEDGFEYSIRELVKDTPVVLDDKIINELKDNAKKLGIKAYELPSGAGHDAMNLKGIAQNVGMIFVPCKDGISHNVKETINFDDAIVATNLLAHTLLNLSNEGE